MLVLFIYISRLASNEIFSPSNKIHREVDRTKDLSAPRYLTYKDSAPASQKTAFIRNTTSLVVLREIILTFSENRKKHANTFCGGEKEFLTVKVAVT